ncbi:UNVERIFIED_CONTAM: hypothetical protein GTU68_029048 [Idotea baltica]|nr:hypothetical protein [Idotea baltica]
MQSVINVVKGKALGVAECLIGTLKDSKFKETGVLTPEEFVAAGDHVVHQCPTWQWVAGDPSKAKSYLPADKQFLITKNVPCYKRCKQMEYKEEQELIVDAEGDEDGGWVDTHHFAEPVSIEEKVKDMTLDDKKILSKEGEEDDDDDEENEAVDMEDFEESGMLEEKDLVSRRI